MWALKRAKHEKKKDELETREKTLKFVVVRVDLFLAFFKCVLALTVTQSESGIVTNTRTNDTHVRIVAHTPGPSGSAAKK